MLVGFGTNRHYLFYLSLLNWIFFLEIAKRNKKKWRCTESIINGSNRFR